jgi:hypothetical protein
MKSKVRCTGESFEVNARAQPTGNMILTECDWKGYRQPGEIQVGPDTYDTRLFPCPRCGGRVALA